MKTKLAEVILKCEDIGGLGGCENCRTNDKECLEYLIETFNESNSPNGTIPMKHLGSI